MAYEAQEDPLKAEIGKTLIAQIRPEEKLRIEQIYPRYRAV